MQSVASSMSRSTGGLCSHGGNHLFASWGVHAMFFWQATSQHISFNISNPSTC